MKLTGNETAYPNQIDKSEISEDFSKKIVFNGTEITVANVSRLNKIPRPVAFTWVSKISQSV